ncbi:hypothetical protein LCGC14_1226470 [marine sediment metagenome]|uniref:Uncharacterized protein n=1 Tax=marine sediment metagenome TaxID=412755 RepID=A0A0F9LDS7_9ZZZZ
MGHEYEHKCQNCGRVWYNSEMFVWCVRCQSNNVETKRIS